MCKLSQAQEAAPCPLGNTVNSFPPIICSLAESKAETLHSADSNHAWRVIFSIMPGEEIQGGCGGWGQVAGRRISKLWARGSENITNHLDHVFFFFLHFRNIQTCVTSFLTPGCREQPNRPSSFNLRPRKLSRSLLLNNLATPDWLCQTLTGSIY